MKKIKLKKTKNGIEAILDPTVPPDIEHTRKKDGLGIVLGKTKDGDIKIRSVTYPQKFSEKQVVDFVTKNAEEDCQLCKRMNESKLPKSIKGEVDLPPDVGPPPNYPPQYTTFEPGDKPLFPLRNIAPLARIAQKRLVGEL